MEFAKVLFLFTKNEDAVSVKVKEVDLGWTKIIAEIRKMKGSYTKVGLPQEGRVEPNPDTGITEMSELVTIGAVHEFGAPNKNIPERSFVRSSTDDNRSRIIKMQQLEISKITAGNSTVELSLKRMGTTMTALMQRKIRQGPFEPLKQSTIDRKGSSKPLIDKGQLIQSIQHVEVIK